MNSTVIHFEEEFRPFHTFNTGSVGQRVANLLVVKVVGFKERLPPGPGPCQTSWPRFDSDRV